jgi:ubiquinone/menaquinone biosynthesis C-methylase UbiE
LSIRKAYTTWAATYDSERNLTRDLDQVVTRDLLSPGHYKRILELGCGTGKNTGLLVQLTAHVIAIDFSEGMLMQARAKLHQDNVTFVVADLTRPFPCAEQCVDLVVCNLVLEHIADLNAIFSETYRVLARPGRFFVCELHPFKQYQGAKATFERGQARTEIPAYVHHLSDFLNAAEQTSFILQRFNEWWHEEDPLTSPRLVSLMFEK